MLFGKKDRTPVYETMLDKCPPRFGALVSNFFGEIDKAAAQIGCADRTDEFRVVVMGCLSAKDMARAHDWSVDATGYFSSTFIEAQKGFLPWQCAYALWIASIAFGDPPERIASAEAMYRALAPS